MALLVTSAEKLKQKVVAALYDRAGLNPNAPLTERMRRDFDETADLVIRTCKRPLDKSRLDKHVAAIQRRNQEFEAHRLLPPIFAGASASSQPGSSRADDDPGKRSGRAAEHHDRVARDASWASFVQKEAEDAKRTEVVRKEQASSQKAEQLAFLRQQVQAEEAKRRGEREDARRLEAALAEVQAKELAAEQRKAAERKRKMAVECLAANQQLMQHRDIKKKEQDTVKAAEKTYVEFVAQEEARLNAADARKRELQAETFQQFIAENMNEEERKRQQRREVREEEKRTAPKLGIVFDGATRRETLVRGRMARQERVYEITAQQTNRANATGRVRSEVKLLQHLDHLAERDAELAEQRKAEQWATHLQRRESLRQRLEAQMAEKSARRERESTLEAPGVVLAVAEE